MIRVWCWLLAVAVLPELSGASNPGVLWELKFSAILAGGLGQSKNLQARDLSYSPDGNWIAAVVGPFRTKPVRQDDLVLIPSSGRADQIRRVPLGQLAASSAYLKTLFWSPDSIRVAVELSPSYLISSFAIFRVADDKVIYRGRAMEEFLGFIDNRRFLVWPRRVGVQNQSVLVSDLEGERPVEWPFSSMRVAVFGPPEIGAVYVRAGNDLRESSLNLVIVDPPTGKVVRQEPAPKGAPLVHFGDGGRIYCFARWPLESYGATPPPPVSCLDVRTGKESLQVGPIHHGEPFDMARDAPVLAATDSYVTHLIFHWFDETDVGTNVKSVVIWDLRRGIEIVRLKGQKQNGQNWDRAARLALAPRGDRHAVAAADVLSLYEIPAQ